MGVGIGPLYITVLGFFFPPYHLCLVHVTLILDLVTHCCVCLVFVDGMGGGKNGWVGFCFYLLGMVWRHFSVQTFLTIRFSLYAWCMGFKSFFLSFFFSLSLFFKSCLFLYLCILCNTDYFESVMGSGGSILYVLSPPPDPSTGINENIKGGKKKLVYIVNYCILMNLPILR